MVKKGGWLGLLFFLVIPSVLAIGIEGPMLSPLIFEPGKEVKADYCLSDYRYDVKVSKGGDFSDFVYLSPLTEKAGKKCFSLEINFPSEIPGSGTYYITLSAEEIPNEEKNEGASISSLTSITRMIKTEVYSQEKDLKISLAAPNANENELMKFIISLQSWSYQDISSVKGRIIIYDEKNLSLASLETKETDLKSKETKNLEIVFDNTGLKPGSYKAEAIVDYDRQQKQTEAYFKIGTPSLKLLNYTKEFETGGIRPFSLQLKSNWNKPINELFAVLSVEGKKVLQTPTISLDAWGEIELKSYWDVALLPALYPGKISLYFDSEKNEFDVALTVKEKARLERPSSFDLELFLLAAAVVLLALILLVLYWKKRKKE